MASSRTQTQSWTSWSGRLQSSAKRATFEGTSSRVVDSGHGRGKRVLAEGTPRQVAGSRPELHTEEHRPERDGELREQASESARRVVTQLAQVHRRGNGGGALLLGLDHRLENRTVRLEHFEGPLAGSDRLEGDPGPCPSTRPGGGAAVGGRGGDAGDVGDMELGHPGQLLEGDAHQRVRVVVHPSVGGDAEGEGAGGLEPTVAPACRGS